MTLNKHGFELHDPLMGLFQQVCVLQVYFLFLTILTSFSLAYFIVRIWYIIHTRYKIGVDQPSVVSVRLLVKSRLLVKWGGSKVNTQVSDCPGASAPDALVVRRSSAYRRVVHCGRHVAH